MMSNYSKICLLDTFVHLSTWLICLLSDQRFETGPKWPNKLPLYTLCIQSIHFTLCTIDMVPKKEIYICSFGFRKIIGLWSNHQSFGSIKRLILDPSLDICDLDLNKDRLFGLDKDRKCLLRLMIGLRRFLVLSVSNWYFFNPFDPNQFSCRSQIIHLLKNDYPVLWDYISI